jgi:hypothetical protein
VEMNVHELIKFHERKFPEDLFLGEFAGENLD